MMGLKTGSVSAATLIFTLSWPTAARGPAVTSVRVSAKRAATAANVVRVMSVSP